MNAQPDGGMRDSLSIVIVNWNTGKLLAECLASLPAAATAGSLVREVVIIDNGSTDDSLNRIDAAMCAGIPLRIEQLNTNVGFGVACNLGAQLSSAPLILFLNPDTVLNAKSLEHPVRYLLGEESAGVDVVSILSTDESGTHTASCARFPTLLQHLAATVGLDPQLARWSRSHMMLEFDHRSDRDVEQVIGAYFLVRRSAFDRIGGFDERFFVYYEEVDFSRRIWQTGGRVRHLAGANYVHVGCGSSRNDPTARLVYSLTSRILYHRKHGGILTVFALFMITYALELPARIFAAVLGRSGLRAGEVLQAYWLLTLSLLRGRWGNGRAFND